MKTLQEGALRRPFFYAALGCIFFIFFFFFFLGGWAHKPQARNNL